MCSKHGLNYRVYVQSLSRLTSLYNPVIHIEEKISLNKQLFDSNLRFINDIIEEDGTMLVFVTFIHMSRFISWNMQALSMALSSIGNKHLEKVACSIIRSNIYSVLRCKKSIFIYEVLNKNSSVTAGRKKWPQLLEIDDRDWIKYINYHSQSQKKTVNFSGFNIELLTKS